MLDDMRIVISKYVKLFFILFLILAPVTGSQASGETITLRFNQFIPRTHFYHYRVLKPWVAEVAKVTEGRVNIRFTTASLGAFHRNFDLANVGITDIAGGNHSSTPGRFVLSQILQSPQLASERAEAISVALWRVYEKYLKYADEHGDTHVLSLHSGGASHLFSLDKPINRVSDLRGMKLYTGGPLNARVMDNIGAISILRSITEAYDLISKGVVDGGLLPHSGITGFGLTDFVKYEVIIPGGFLPGSFFLVIHNKSWDRISPADQQAIMEISGEHHGRRAGSVMDVEAKTALDILCRSHIEISVADDEFVKEFNQHAGFIDKEWKEKANAAGLPAEEALNYFHQQVFEYAKSLEQLNVAQRDKKSAC